MELCMYMYSVHIQAGHGTEIELPCLSGKRCLCPCITLKIRPAQLSCLSGSVGRVSE